MTQVAFAFIVATFASFLFRQTRWMGVVGTFVLLSIRPALTSGLLAAAAVTYLLIAYRRRRK